jgi:hypothetical protein
MNPRHWILVAGTGRYELPRPVEWIARSIGAHLAQEGYGLVAGGWHGVDYVAAEAFANQLPLSAHPSDFLVQIVRTGCYPQFKRGRFINVGAGPAEWIEQLRYADAVLLVGGVGGTYETYVYAGQERRAVFAVGGTGGDARRVFDEIVAGWTMAGPWGVPRQVYGDVLGRYIDSPGAADAVTDALMAMLRDHLAFIDPTQERRHVFVSYSHKDMAWLRLVLARLKSLPHEPIALWTDAAIERGESWDAVVQSALGRSKAAILIVTPNFLGSDYIRQFELPRLLNLSSSGLLRIFWILAEPCDWNATGLASIEAANDPNRPLSILSPTEQHQSLVEIAKAVADHVSGAPGAEPAGRAAP